MEPRVAISDDFLSCFAEAPKPEQKRIQEFLTKFRHDPQSAGINYEKINDAADPKFRSVRIGQNYRGIIAKPDTGNVYMLMWVDNHDDAYEWARKHKCGIHPETGSIQLVPAEHAEEPRTEPPESAGSRPSDPAEPIFSEFRDRELRRLGVPDEQLALVGATTSREELEALEKRLPREAFEALTFLADGVPLDEVMHGYALPAGPVDTGDFSAALEREQTQRKFVVVDDDADLRHMLEAPLEKWRVFLHPSQRQLASWDVNGPIRVLGGAGTGKTVVAMHRARWLVKELFTKPQQKILFTTFTVNLATDIRENLKKICTSAEMDRIEVINIDGWVSRFLKQQDWPHRIIYSGTKTYSDLWKLALDCRPADPDLPDSFFAEEWERIVIPQRIQDRNGYFRASRIGRGVPLTRKQRAAIWPVFEEMQVQLQRAGYRTPETATQDAVDLMKSGKTVRPYEAIVVDEAQDMGPDAMKLLRTLVPERPNDLFIVGDGHQRIYRKKYALSHCGINIRGRSRKLRINYRTTEETRKFAMSVLEDQPIDDLDEGRDSDAGYRSLMHGRDPEISFLDSIEDEASWISDEIQKLVDNGINTADICVVCRTKRLLDRFSKLLREKGFMTRQLSRDASDQRADAGVRLATMHRVKGLEFRYVFLAAINKDVVPHKSAFAKTQDPTERRSSELNERALFHVAASRAIRRLWVSSSGEPSQFLVQA